MPEVGMPLAFPFPSQLTLVFVEFKLKLSF